MQASVMTRGLGRFKLSQSILSGAFFCFMGWGCGNALAEGSSAYTSTQTPPCRKAPSSLYKADEDALECPGTQGWRVFSVGTPDRSWIDVGRGDTLWSTMELVTNDPRLGYFPNLQGKQVEWRLGPAPSRAPTALIFRVSGQNPEEAGKNFSHLMVIGFIKNIPHFCGIAKSNEEARALADGLSGCEALKKSF